MKKHIHKLTPADFEWVFFAIYDLGYTMMTSKTEAEKYCSYLCTNGTVNAVLSDDTDLFAHLCPKILSKYNPFSNTCYFVVLQSLLDELGLSRSEFVDFCIMCGTDYNKNCPQIGTLRAFNFIKKYKSIENFSEQTQTCVDMLNYKRVRELFALM